MPKPKMHKMFTGRAKTRPIPVVVDQSEIRASKAAAADQKPKGKYVNMPSGPRPNAKGVLGTKIKGGVNGGNYNHGVADTR